MLLQVALRGVRQTASGRLRFVGPAGETSASCRDRASCASKWGSGGRGFKSRRPDSASSGLASTCEAAVFLPHSSGAVWGPFLGVICHGRCAISQLPRLAHHRQQRVLIGLLVARQQRLHIPPATGRGGQAVRGNGNETRTVHRSLEGAKDHQEGRQSSSSQGVQQGTRSLPHVGRFPRGTESLYAQLRGLCSATAVGVIGSLSPVPLSAEPEVTPFWAARAPATHLPTLGLARACGGGPL
jgi:hypothetical protein